MTHVFLVVVGIVAVANRGYITDVIKCCTENEVVPTGKKVKCQSG